MHFIERHPRVLITIAAILYLVPGIVDLPLLDRDEPRFARATIEMMEKQEWVIPYFNNDYRFDKPPLTYWWMRLNYSIFGKHEFSARLHSVIASWITALVLFQISMSSGFKLRKSIFSALIWLTSFQVLIHSRIAVADMLLIACLTITLFALLKYLRKDAVTINPYSKWFYLLYISMALGFLAKGPIALLIPLMTVALSSIFFPKESQNKNAVMQLAKESFYGLILTTAIIALWGIPALIQTQGAYFDIGLNKHVIQRGIESFDNRSYIPGVYYLFIILIFINPWVSKLVPTLKRAWENKKEDTYDLILLSWIFSTFLIFAFYKTQLPHYILPAYPAIALLIAKYYNSVPSNTFQISVWIHRLIFSSLIVALIFIALNLNNEPFIDLQKVSFLLASFLFTLLLASECAKRNLKKQTLILIAFASLLFFPLTNHLRNTHITINTHELIKEIDTPISNFYTIGFTEPSLIWYLDDYCIFLDDASIKTTELKDNDCLIILSRQWKVSEKSVKKWLTEKTNPTYYDRKALIFEVFKNNQILWSEGFNPGNGSWVELAIITK